MAFFIVDYNLIDGSAVSRQLMTLGAAEKSQSCGWKTTFDLAKQRQGKDRIANKTRLQDQNVVPPGAAHDLQPGGFLDQHHWNVVFNRVDKAASSADEAIALIGQLYVSFAFGTSQYIQEFFVNSHF
jgi:hypothetical protein